MKMAFIVVKLVPEADEKANEELEKEILREFEEPPRITLDGRNREGHRVRG